VLAGDALQGGADRRVAGRPGQAAQPVLLADRGEAPVERGAGVQPGQSRLDRHQAEPLSGGTVST
jgi:hypothetical protein